VDADLRRPSVAERLGLSPGAPGLVEAILDLDVALLDVLAFDQRYNLAVLPAGRSSEHPYEVLKSPHLGDFLQQLRQVFHYVIVDTAPVMPCPDPRLIEPWVDGFLMVVSAHRTPKSVVESALDLMDRSRMLGLVLNGDDDARAYGRRYSGYTPSGRSNGSSRKGRR
jgi:Mrp family chromosome partitioning ATPase